MSSFAVQAGGVGVLVNPLAPPPGSSAELWMRLHALAPEAVVILKPDHVRDLFVRWYVLARRLVSGCDSRVPRNPWPAGGRSTPRLATLARARTPG